MNLIQINWGQMCMYTPNSYSLEKLTHWKRLWCWEGLGAGGERDDRGWDVWIASPTRWTLSLSELWELVMDRECCDSWGCKELDTTQRLNWLTNWCKLLYREWIKNKVLLYSTGNYIQYPVISHNGKQMQKSKMSVWGGLTNSCEKKRGEKQRRKGKI